MITAALSADELRALPAVIDVPTAGRAYGISERHAYELARRGEFPVPVRDLGRLKRVRRADLLADLGIHDNSEAGPASPATATADLATAWELKSHAG
jgi:predicted DNA-binding transcriptional regulator AlpA